ncbi:cyclic nucleotide-binding domain-containing protein (plasmid) [Streptomyces sp. BHT-5-2]|uniref:cyclic nucleotide-binding domain-containing protein n=1 Tax=unclassified Streptomyces TaxID=2593676 RepID=UPI001C8E6856|nr:cyclic nucleotide-binding domain-containing protein [Streptomyces sp. BHT-5-2]QZL08898.1 cyclic nucleotide-binding domain-containing protein [Streptomyces sp. BHT-5-2]
MTPDRSGFLDALPPVHRDRLLTLAQEISFPVGLRIFDEGGTADRFWVIRSGTVALDVYEPGRGAAVVETLGEGELLGWSWLFEPYRWHLGARTRAPVTAYEFDAERVRGEIDADPAFGLAVTRCVAAVAIGRRLRAARIRLLDLYGPPGSAPRTGSAGAAL